MTRPESTPSFRHALVVGAGPGLGAALARRFAAEGLRVSLAARNPQRLDDLCRETGATAYACDAVCERQVAELFESLGADGPDLVVYNAGNRAGGAILDIDAEAARGSIEINAFGALLVAREAARRMQAAGRGALLFTGATASVKAFAGSAPFAMGKFALRALAQSLARELAPLGIHVAHFVIDGGILSPRRQLDAEQPDRWLEPAAIAEAYWSVANQHRSAWTWEVELRPWLEKF